MVHQALADTGKRRAHVDSQVLQVTDRPNDRAQEVGRRVDGAAGKDHFARSKRHTRPMHLCRYADATLAFEQQLADLGVGQDCQIAALPGYGVEITNGCGNAPLVDIGDRDRVVAVLPLAVLIGQVLETGGLEGLGRRLGMFVPQVGENAAHGDAALIAVQRPIEVHVALDPLVVREHVIPAPAAARAARHPLVEVGRRSAIGELTVDRGTSAEHARLLVFAQRRRVLLRIVVRDDLGPNLELRPVEAGVEVGRAGIAVEDFGWDLAVWCVLARFKQEHPSGALCRQPVSQYRPGRTAANDDEVVN